jgi:hypothetical protein
MGFVFVSYSRKDQKVVDFIVSKLKDDGFDVWIDRENIRGGDHWQERIVKAIKTTDAVVLMLSPNSAQSDNVGKEVGLAGTSKRRLFPMLLAPVDVPDNLMYQLSGIQWIEFHLNPENKYSELVEVLRAHQQTVSAMPETRQVEVVLGSKTAKEFGKKEQDELIKRLAPKAKTSRTNLKLVKITDGSAHIFIDMPADAAYSLTTAALNRDRDMISQGINAMRLDGEEDYILLKTGGIGPLNLKPPRSFLPRLLLILIGAGVLLMGLLATALALTPMFNPPTSTPTLSPTLTATFTVTNTATATSTSTFAPTASPSRTPTSTYTATASFTPSHTPTLTFTPTPNLVKLYGWWSFDSYDNFASTKTDMNRAVQKLCASFEFYSSDYSLIPERPIEGRIFSPNDPQPPNTIALYSWYSCSRSDGLIITTWLGTVGDERIDTSFPNNYDKYYFLQLEGYIYKDEVPGTIPLYQWWSESKEDYYVTTLWTGDIGDIRSPGYTLYQVEGYVFPP